MSKNISSTPVDDTDDTEDCREWFVLQTSFCSVDAVFSSGLNRLFSLDMTGFELGGWDFATGKRSCMGDSLAGDVTDRFRGLSNSPRPGILTGTGAFGGNKEYLLVGEGSGLVIVNGALGSVGDVIRRCRRRSTPLLGSSSSVIDGSVVEVLTFLLLSADVVKLSTALARRASSDEDLEAAGRLLIMTV